MDPLQESAKQMRRGVDLPHDAEVLYGGAFEWALLEPNLNSLIYIDNFFSTVMFKVIQ